VFTALHFAALLCYGLTGALVGAPFLRLRSTVAGGTLPLAAGSAAVTLHFAALLAYARSFGVLPLSGVAPALSSLAFLVGLLALLVLWLTREWAIALVAAPLVILLLITSIGVGFGRAPANVGPRDAWFVLHVGASLLGIALLAVAFAASALYLLQHRQLKTRHFGAIFQLFPPLEQLDRLNYVALVLGFPTLTLGVALGVGYAGFDAGVQELGIAHLGWGLAAWVVLGAIAGLRLAGRLRGRRAALGSVLGFAVIAAAYATLVLLRHGPTRFL
jgi:ABC-type transport system involved in cytochrome c biogenesis permease subunit